MRSSRRRQEPAHPPAEDLDLLEVLHALADPTRMIIVSTLMASPERACGTFPVEVAASTLSHHFRVLREAGVIYQRDDGTRRWTSLREADLEHRFPGLIKVVAIAWHEQEGVRLAAATDSARARQEGGSEYRDRFGVSVTQAADPAGQGSQTG